MADKKPPLEPQLVMAFVGNAHGDLNKAKELLAQEPALINAAWDWGGGDWETALGAASHVGNKGIAMFLIGSGARMDIFAAAMLGKEKIVREMIADNPLLKTAKGPHGIPLVTHAKAGGRRGKGRAYFPGKLSGMGFQPMIADAHGLEARATPGPLLHFSSGRLAIAIIASWLATKRERALKAASVKP